MFTYPQHVTTQVNFQLLNAENKILTRKVKQWCFYDIVQCKINDDVKFVRFYFNKKYTPYDSEFIVKYTALINSFGFPFIYEGLKWSIHSFRISLDDMDESKIRFVSTLIIIRYLLEDRLFVIPQVMFDLIEKGEEPFIAFQKAHDYSLHSIYLRNYYTGNHNHAVMWGKNRIFTKEEFDNKVKQQGKTLYINSGIYISHFWANI